MIVVIIMVNNESILYSFSYPSQFLLVLDLNFYTVFDYSFSFSN